MTTTHRTAPGWTVLVPVKGSALAKSRLSDLGGTLRPALAFAFALDTVAAALATPGVDTVVVVCRAGQGDQLAALGAELVDDVPAAGLNPALAHAEAVVRRGRSTGLVALLGDLPALTPTDLGRALSCEADRFFVADTAGAGSTLLATRPGCGLEPRFGPGSRARHLASGAVEVMHPLPSLRRDVDTVADLRDALAIGIGPHTAGVLASSGLLAS